MFNWTVAFYSVSIVSGLMGISGSTGPMSDALLVLGMSLCLGYLFTEHQPPPG